MVAAVVAVAAGGAVGLFSTNGIRSLARRKNTAAAGFLEPLRRLLLGIG
jgi:hypothetical protein